jgi:hypothetical protein
MLGPGQAFGLAGDSGCGLLSHHFHELPLRGKDESCCGAGGNAGRDFQVLAAVALDRLSDLCVPADDSVGADHGAHPAAHAVLSIAIDDACYRVLAHGPGAADGYARRVLAVAANEGHLLPFRHLHIDPSHRPRLLGCSGKYVPAGGMLHRAGHFAGLAAQAAVQADENFFFHILPLQPQFLSLALDMIDHERCRLEGVRLHCKGCTHHILSAGGEKPCNSRASQHRWNSSEHREDS